MITIHPNTPKSHKKWKTYTKWRFYLLFLSISCQKLVSQSNLQNSPYNSSITSEIILMDEQERLEPSPLSLLWKKQTVLNIADNTSPRVARLVGTIASILAASPPGHFSQKQKETISSTFSCVGYPRAPGSGPICRRSDDGLKYYRCFTCELTRGSCICEACFSDPQHLNHQFKIITSGPCYCDCGNQEYLRKEFFCKAHAQHRAEHVDDREDRTAKERNKGKGALLQKRDAEVFNKEIEFLLTLGILSKLTSDQNTIEKAQHLATKIIQVLLGSCANSLAFQKLASEVLLLHPRKQFKIPENTTLLHQYLWNQWISQSLNKGFAKLLCQLYSHEPMRRKIIIDYFHLHTSEVRKLISMNPLTQIDSQYFLEGKLILKLLKANAIPPLTLNYKFTTIDSSPGCFIQIYRAYRIMAETSSFPQILEETLKRVNFATFFSFAIIDRQSRAAVNIVTKHFLYFLRLVLKTLQKMAGKKEAQLKIIRESYQYMKAKQQTFNYCPERTFCLCLFSYLSCSLHNLPSISDTLTLLGEPSLSLLLQILQNLLESYFNLLRIQNYNDYRQLTSQKYELNSANRIVIALDYLCLRTAFSLLQLGNCGEVVVPVRNCLVGRVSMLQKWVHLFRVEQIKRQSITDPDAKAQIATLLETGLFIKPEDQIAGTTIEVVAIVNSLLFACESELCEAILANLLGKPDREKVLQFYREYAWLQPNKSKSQAKTTLEAMIDCPPLVKEFIQTQRDSYSRGEKTFTYVSNLSYCSRFFNDELTDDSTQRLIKKLALPSPCSPLSRLAFNDEVIQQLIKYTRLFVRFLTGPHIDLIQTASLSVTFNLLLEAIIVVYIETRQQKLKDIFLQLNLNQQLTAIYTDYTKIIVQIFIQNSGKQPLRAQLRAQEKPEADRREAVRHRRQQMMKQMRQRQQKILQQHHSPNEKTPSQQFHQNCIICKTPSSAQHPLSFLCSMRFTNTLPLNILQSHQPMLLITTCGHMIHEKCLAQNIDAHDEYGTNYNCFLCRQISNLRVPLTMAHPESFVQYLMTIVAVEVGSNPSLQAKQQEYTHLATVGKLMFESVALGVHLYYFSVGKFYINHILPLVKAQIILLRWITHTLQAHLPKPNSDERRFRMIEEKVYWAVANVIQSNGARNQKERIDRELIDQLFNKILGIPPHNSPHFQLKQINQLQRLNFFPLPKDLRALSKQIGKCRSCSKFINRSFACFLCGFKVCGQCSEAMNRHVDGHLGATVLIDLQTGRYNYRYRNIQISIASLYANYAAQEFSAQSQSLPPEGEYQLSQERVEKLIGQVLKDTVQSTVQGYVREVQGAPACNVQ